MVLAFIRAEIIDCVLYYNLIFQYVVKFYYINFVSRNLVLLYAAQGMQNRSDSEKRLFPLREFTETSMRLFSDSDSGLSSNI